MVSNGQSLHHPIAFQTIRDDRFTSVATLPWYGKHRYIWLPQRFLTWQLGNYNEEICHS